MHKFRDLVVALVGLVLVASGILLATFSTAIGRSYDNPSLEVVIRHGGNLTAVLGVCFVVLAYLQRRRTQNSDRGREER